MVQIVEPHTSSFEKFKTTTVSNKRKLLMKELAHSYVDQIWNIRKYCTRSDVYVSYQKTTGRSLHSAHISKQTVTSLKVMIAWAVEILNKGRELDMKYKNYKWELVEIPNYDFLTKL